MMLHQIGSSGTPKILCGSGAGERSLKDFVDLNSIFLYNFCNLTIYLLCLGGIGSKIMESNGVNWSDQDFGGNLNNRLREGLSKKGFLI